MKNPLSYLALLLILTKVGGASASDAFDCVRDLMPITAQADFQATRTGVEKPFMITDKFMAFPEVTKTEVTGFYVYSHGNAWYYDSVESNDAKSKPITELKHTGEFSLYNLIAQPSGLETVTVQYMPGFGNNETTGGGPVMLGASVLPVVGAFVSRANDQLHVVFRNPAEVDEADLKRWVYDHLSRKPAAVSAIEIDHQMLHLKTGHGKSKAELWAPLQNEIKLRQHWVQTNNLDEGSFRKLSVIMESTCK